jgi:hypothetical protein
MKAAVDRIEGSMAVLITQEDNPITFNIPVSFLGDVREGDIVEITIKRNIKNTRAARERVASRIEKLKKKSNQ